MIGGTHKSSGLGHRVDGGPRPGIVRLGGAIGSVAKPNPPRNQLGQTAYIVRLVAQPHVADDPARGLRRALKYIGRYCGLKATSVERVRQ